MKLMPAERMAATITPARIRVVGEDWPCTVDRRITNSRVPTAPAKASRQTV